MSRVNCDAVQLRSPFSSKPNSSLLCPCVARDIPVELLRSHPVDGVVFSGGSDKTTPSLLMGAIGMALPAIGKVVARNLGAT